MKIIFLSNYFTHHQKPLCDFWGEKCGIEFEFIETTNMPSERMQHGWRIEKPQYVYFFEKKLFNKKIELADIVICGSAPNYLIQHRIKRGKLVYRYSERPLKSGLELRKFIPRLIKWNLMNPINKPIYLLSASAYAPGDYAKFNLFKEKSYKWGYFPETKRYEDIKSIIEIKQKNRILWCGRFIGLKHPESVIEVAKRLKEEGYHFEIRCVGSGIMKNHIQMEIVKNNLEDCVKIYESVPTEKVREYMESVGIYLFTSDKQEGWGAVLNESMNSGCAVIASHAIGAVPYLMKDNENGLIFKSEDWNMLYEKVKYLLDYPEEQQRLGLAAYYTIVNEWNAECAAERLIKLTEHILKGEKSPNLYEDGPCSKAEIIREDWYKS